MKHTHKKAIVFFVLSMFVLSVFACFNDTVSAQAVRGYKRDSNYTKLGGSGDSGTTNTSGSNLSGANNSSSQTSETSQTSSQNQGSQTGGNTGASSPSTSAPNSFVDSFYNSDKYNQWHDEVNALELKRDSASDSQEEAYYDSQIELTTKKYFPEGIPNLPPVGETSKGERSIKIETTSVLVQSNNPDYYWPEAKINYIDSKKNWRQDSCEILGNGIRPSIVFGVMYESLPKSTKQWIVSSAKIIDDTALKLTKQAIEEIDSQTGEDGSMETIDIDPICEPKRKALQLIIDKYNTELKGIVTKGKEHSDNDTNKQNTQDKENPIIPRVDTYNTKTAQQAGINKQVVLTRNDGSAIGDIKVYPAGSLPKLAPGEVLIKGWLGEYASRIENGELVPMQKDTYFVANKNTLPEGYILQGVGEINVGGMPQERGLAIELANLDFKNYVPVYDIYTKADVIAMNNSTSMNGEFKFDFKELSTVFSKDSKTAMQVVNSVLSTVTGNDAVMGHLAVKQYTKGSEKILSDFGTYGNALSKDLSMEQREKSVYKYVNEKIAYQYPEITASHSLEQAISCGQGVCRDKSAALEYALEAAGIQADEVIASKHVFVVVYNSDGKVDHYLDPMYYDTYIPLQRAKVDSDQIIKRTVYKCAQEPCVTK